MKPKKICNNNLHCLFYIPQAYQLDSTVYISSSLSLDFTDALILMLVQHFVVTPLQGLDFKILQAYRNLTNLLFLVRFYQVYLVYICFLETLYYNINLPNIIRYSRDYYQVLLHNYKLNLQCDQKANYLKEGSQFVSRLPFV